MRFHQTAALDFVAADTTIGTVTVDIPARSGVSRVAVAFTDAIPTAGVIRVCVLKDGGNPATAADYHVLATLTAPGIVLVPAGASIRVVGFSGTGTGTVAATVLAD